MNKNYRVLITDDDKDIHDVLNMAFHTIDSNSSEKKTLKRSLLEQLTPRLEKENFEIEVFHAFQGQEAISILKNETQPKMDLLVLDMLMPPGINGAQVLKELGENSKDLKIIISTAYFHDLENDIREISKSFESVHLLLKPYNISTFSDLVKKLLYEDESFLPNENILKLK